MPYTLFLPGKEYYDAYKCIEGHCESDGDVHIPQKLVDVENVEGNAQADRETEFDADTMLYESIANVVTIP